MEIRRDFAHWRVRKNAVRENAVRESKRMRFAIKKRAALPLWTEIVGRVFEESATDATTM